MIKNTEYVKSFGNFHLDSHIHTGVPHRAVTLLLYVTAVDQFYILSFIFYVFYMVAQTHTIDFFLLLIPFLLRQVSCMWR